MNTKEIVEQTGITMDYVYDCYKRDIERFVKLVRADEREACAKLCEKMSESVWTFSNFAEAIRARGEK